MAPNMPKFMSSDAVLAAANARLRKKCMGSIGSFVRNSQTTKAARSRMPPAREESTVMLVQPAPLPLTMPQTSPSRPVLTRARPGRSSALSCPWVSRKRLSASGMSAIPMGTLSQKIHCQAIPSITIPPTRGPLATAIPATALQRPSATPRR